MFFSARRNRAKREEEKAGKAGTRFYYKSVGLGIKTPREAIEGAYIDKKCPFTNDVSISLLVLATVPRWSGQSSSDVIIYLHWVKKYQRYEKRHSNIAAHVSPCFRVKEGDHVIIGQCRRLLSKTAGEIQCPESDPSRLFRRRK